MMNDLRVSKGMGGMISLSLIILFLISSLSLAGTNDVQFKGDLEKYVTSHPELSEKISQVKTNQKFHQFAKEKFRAAKQHKLFQQKIKDYPFEEKIALFLKYAKKLETQHGSMKAFYEKTRKQRMASVERAANGSIQGTVSLEGQPPFFGDIEVVVFDEYGFFVDGVFASSVDGTYEVNGLYPGDYFVLTRSPYVDEFYDNIPAAFKQEWRNASLVTVAEGGTATGIDFDLLRGAKITGTVYETDGTTPLAFNSIFFNVYLADRPLIITSPFAFTTDQGKYEINIPMTGSFKIEASSFDRKPEFYDEKPDWMSADPIVVNSLADSIGGKDFSLEPDTTVIPDLAGGTIQGTVYEETGSMPIGAALVVAFDVSDTSIASLGISNSDTLEFNEGGPGDYQLPGLSPGSYVVLANDFIGPYEGEYYENAETPDAATPLTVTENETITDIDFTLPMGGSISGNITSATGDSLESVLVVAVKADFSGLDGWISEKFDLGFTISDNEGNYVIPGLSSGEYILRTVSLFSPHADSVLDEYYDDVQSIFDYSDATPVQVNSPDPTIDINFELELGGGIAGHFYEVGTTTPVQGEGFVVAINVSSELPAFAIPKYNPTDGAFELRPLPTGVYVLLGLVAQADTVSFRYIPQFYDGASSPDGANPLSVIAPDNLTGIDFQMVRSGTIRGMVFIEPNFPVGADSLSQTMVAAFDASTGDFRGSGDVTFAGGYRIPGLVPGDYKVVAYPIYPGFAATYYGGGATFDDANSSVLTVTPDDTANADITLASGEGVISGTVYAANSTRETKPLNGVLVLAYDQTGHAVSAGLSGLDINTGLPTMEPGGYQIPGLIGGDYYVRTFSLFQLLFLLQNLEQQDIALRSNAFAPYAIQQEDLDSLNLELHVDAWYDGVVLEPAEIDLFSLVFRLLFLGGESFFPVPLATAIHAEADPVSVSSPGVTPDIDFNLPSVEDLITSTEPLANNALPEKFQLFQNYPNPFNPVTNISFQVPNSAHIQVNVYNILGQKVKTLIDGMKNAGSYTVQWNGKDENGQQVASGFYVIQLTSNEVDMTRKMILMR